MSGVPQGSVLGPLLFLPYVNDIPNYITSTCRLYVDDYILCRQIDSPANAATLQNDLTKLEEWKKRWKTLLNIDKCMVIRVTLKRRPLITSCTLHSLPLASFNTAKYLGVTFLSYHLMTILISSVRKPTLHSLSFVRNFSSC